MPGIGSNSLIIWCLFRFIQRELVKRSCLLYNRRMQLEKKVAVLLLEKRKTVAVAESCSGGLLSHRLTNIPGSSKYFKGAVVAYSNHIKSSILKVPSSLLRKYGAVSESIATQMAKNVRRLFKTDFGIAITGIAGPTGGTKNKPVGLNYIAVSTNSKTLCLQCRFKGNRLAIKRQATTQALKTLLEFLSA